MSSTAAKMVVSLLFGRGMAHKHFAAAGLMSADRFHHVTVLFYLGMSLEFFIKALLFAGAGQDGGVALDIVKWGRMKGRHKSHDLKFLYDDLPRHVRQYVAGEYTKRGSLTLDDLLTFLTPDSVMKYPLILSDEEHKVARARFKIIGLDIPDGASNIQMRWEARGPLNDGMALADIMITGIERFYAYALKE